MNNISAVILAAGSGTRIGIPKLKLKIDGDYFINLVVSKLKFAGIENIVCIVRNDDKEWFNQNVLSVPYLENLNPESGMIHSVLLGINHFEDSYGVIVFPVDHPLVKTDTITSLIEVFEAKYDSIVKPVFKGISGHPIIVPNRLFKFIKGSDNLNLAIQNSGLQVLQLPVEDDGILKNINHKEDLTNIPISDASCSKFER